MRINRGQLEGLARAAGTKTHVIVADIKKLRNNSTNGWVNGLIPKVLIPPRLQVM
jgi:hypothetical protein